MKSQFLRTAFLLFCITGPVISCKTKNDQAAPAQALPVPPAQYGQPPVGAIPGVPEQPGGRFGYTGASPAPGTAPPAPGMAAPAPAPTPGMRDVRDLAPGTVTAPASGNTAPTTPPPAATPSTSDMPFANAVPGNPLVVTLPGSGSTLGQISVEKYDSSGKPTGEALKRGTQVQIPDPNNPGKKIYFKVP